jgi:exopolysaccharide production protein ExoQ
MRHIIDKVLKVGEPVFAVFVLLFFMGAVFPVMRNPDHWFQDARASDPVAFVVQLLVYVFTLLLVMSVWRPVLTALRTNPLMTALLGLALVSVVWSGVPGFTLRRSIALMATTAFGLYLGSRFTPSQQVRLFAYALGISVILSLVFVAVFPRYGIESGPNEGAWRGVFIQKNTFGRYMVMAVVTLLCMPVRRMERLTKVFLVAIALVLLAGSVSAGSYVMMAASFLLIFLYRFFSLTRKAMLPVGMIAAILLTASAALLFTNSAALFDILNRSSSLTGRVPLWETLLYTGASHAWLGYGYVGFWAVENHYIWSIIGWTPLKAHNGYIDLWLELGYVGLGLFVPYAVIVGRRCIRFIRREQTLESQWPLLMFSTVLLHNMVESDLLITNGFLWIVFVAIALSTQRALQADSEAVAAAEVAQPEADGLEPIPCPQ